MKSSTIKLLILSIAIAAGSVADAKGGSSSSSGGSRGGSSSSSYSRPSTPSVAPRPNSAPHVAPNRPNSAPQVAPNRPNSQPVVTPNRAAPNTANAGGQRSTTTTTSTTSRSYSSRVNYGGGYMYGGWGMGYPYSNGLLTGIIIGNMMHPHGTVMYTGGGHYNNNAVMYSDGRVVDQRGMLVGHYVNGVFTPVANGSMVAREVPSDAYAPAPQPVVVQSSVSTGEIILGILVFIAIIVLLLFWFL